MTSIASSGTSPLSGYEHLHGEFLGDEESWAFISQPGTSNPGSSVGFFPSPDAASSLRSFGIVGRTAPNGQASHNGHGSQSGAPSQSGQSQVQPSPPAPSPLFLDQEQHQFSLPAYLDQASLGPVDPGSFVDQVDFSGHVASAFAATSAPADIPFSATSAPPDLGSSHFPTNAVTAAPSLLDGRLFRTGEFGLDDHDNQDFTPYLAAFSSIAPQHVPRSLDSPACVNPSPTPIDIPAALQHDANVPPWNPAVLKQDDHGAIFAFEEYLPQANPVTPTTSSPVQSGSPHSDNAVSPVSPSVKQEHHQLLQVSSVNGAGGSQKPVTDVAIRKVRDARVGKKRSSPSEAGISSGGSSLSSSVGGGGSSGGAAASKFVIMTPMSIGAHVGKPNLFECFDAMRMTQRGRKGPLANQTKENALQVRRVGACFCCHARKVRCDAERPCKNCKKLTCQVPQIVCWQFQDFLGPLFPEMIRAHFRKEEMAKFLDEVVAEFRINGAERRCVVELSSGWGLRTVLRIPAKAFTAKVPDVLQHWRQDRCANGQVSLTHGVAAPIGLEVESNAQREEVRKLAREYIHGIIEEPGFAEEMAREYRDNNGHIKKMVLQIIQTYAFKSNSEIAKRALTIYTLQYVLSHHMTLTQKGLAELARQGLASSHHASQTVRLLARQFKAIVDEIAMREVQLIFEAFSKSLKPKMRKEWAPCTAAFIAMVMFMEEVEVAADTFVTALNQISHDRNKRFEYNRLEVVGLNLEIENMPFKQFAYQFHQVYQTHPSDPSAKSFNPLVDDSLLNETDLGDPAAVEMVRALRKVLQRPELVNMTMEPILGNMEIHPHPRDVSEDYSGRLLAKFLLSFTSMSYLLDPAC